jgi:hypothetical protein
MTRVPMAKNRDAGIDDAHHLDIAIDAYSSWLGSEFLSTWSEAIDRYFGERIAIRLVPAEVEVEDIWHAVIINRTAEGIDDAHYLDWAITVHQPTFSDGFNKAWPAAYRALRANQTPIELVEGDDIQSETGAQLPEYDIILAEPPVPEELPATSLKGGSE